MKVIQQSGPTQPAISLTWPSAVSFTPIPILRHCILDSSFDISSALRELPSISANRTLAERRHRLIRRTSLSLAICDLCLLAFGASHRGRYGFLLGRCHCTHHIESLSFDLFSALSSRGVSLGLVVFMHYCGVSPACRMELEVSLCHGGSDNLG